jgi:3',5'-nucleoside bisphosphate phosphatase
MIVDLHSHTTASDGALEPEALVAAAVARGVNVLAVTDHDTVDAITRCRAAAATGPMRLLAGVEISCFVDATEIHVLGLAINPESPGFRDWLSQLIAVRVERIHRMAAVLEDHGIRIDVSDLVRPGRVGSVGRPHIARLLIDGGHVRNIDDAFKKWLSPGRPAHVERLRVPAKDAIEKVHEAGGVAVQAHPGQMGRDEDIPTLLEWGLDGLEVFHPDHNHAMKNRYANLCADRGIIATGGSDYHGIDQHGAPLGSRSTPAAAFAEIEKRARL